MRALRTCDFCDGEAVGTFEVVPPELEPTETEQRRVVLCTGCRDQLEDLLEPLLARAGVESSRVTADADGAETPTDADATEDPVPPADADTTDDSGTVIASANESTRPTSSPNATVSDLETDDTGTASDSEPDSDATPDSGLDGGITFERSEPSESTASNEETDDDTPGGETGEETTSDVASDTGADASDATARDSADQASANRPPKAYGKVVRLLQNREFPVERSAVENLAAGAYDLESYEVEAVVDHALEQGELVEDRGALDRP